MTLKQRGSSSVSTRMAAFVLAVAAIAGWGAYIYATLGNMRLEEHLSAQSAALQDSESRLAAQRQKAEASAKESEGLRTELAAARSEMQRVKAEADAELAKTRDQLAAASQPGLSLAGGISPEVLRIKPRPTKEDVMAAQEALTQLRFATLEADGVIGPSTRQAIEAFQRAAGLEPSGELQAQTLLALTRAAKVVAAQGERLEQPL